MRTTAKKESPSVVCREEDSKQTGKNLGHGLPRGNLLPFMERYPLVPHDRGTVLIHSMSNTPSTKAILQLYASMLRTSRSFSSYNFREYFLRRTKATFREIQVCNAQ
jgi:hypothetical protein